MNRALVAELALRLLALYTWAQAVWQGIRQLTLYSTFHVEGLGVDPFVALSVSTAAYILCGIILYAGARSLSRRMFPVEPDVPLKNHAEIGGLALRILGIVLWTWAVETVPNSLVHALIGNEWGFSVMSVGMLLFLVMGTWLFLRGNKIAVWLLRTAPATGGKSMEYLQAVGIAVAGLVVFATSLPDGILVAAGWLARRFGEVSKTSLFGRYEWPASFTPIALMIIGFALFVGGSGIAYFWHKARTAGLTSETPRAEAKT